MYEKVGAILRAQSQDASEDIVSNPITTSPGTSHVIRILITLTISC